MSVQRSTLLVLLIVALLAPGASVSLARPAAVEPGAATAAVAAVADSTDYSPPNWAGVPSVPPVLAAQVAAGDDHTCAVTEDGGVKCWGWNWGGQLGDGTQYNDRTTPVDVVGLSSGVQSVTASWGHTCAVTEDGGVKCWGSGYGVTPVDVVGLGSGVQAIAAGGVIVHVRLWAHTCALTEGDGVKCWGSNELGQLGDGTTSDRAAPVDVIGLTGGVRAIAAGGTHTCALTESGGVKCWGYNGNGQLGDGTWTQRTAPVDVWGLTSGMRAIYAGIDHTCALTEGGVAKCWGSNRHGQLGDGGMGSARNTPVDVVGLGSGVRAVGAGGGHTCALTEGGGAKCWGWNNYGQLGDATTTDRTAPVDVFALRSGMRAIAAGGSHTCGLTEGGGVKCWGQNESGQLGDGTRTNRTTPVDVLGFWSGPYRYLPLIMRG